MGRDLLDHGFLNGDSCSTFSELHGLFIKPTAPGT